MVFLGNNSIKLIQGLQFSIPDGIQSETDRYLHINKLSVLHNVGNVPFFEHMHSKLAKSANMTK
jgi:hypothetical protein